MQVSIMLCLSKEGEGSGVAWAGATREGGSRIIRAPPGLQVTRPRLEPQWRAAPAINNSTKIHNAPKFWGAVKLGEKETAMKSIGDGRGVQMYNSQTQGTGDKQGRTICRTVTRKATFLTLTRCPEGPS